MPSKENFINRKHRKATLSGDKAKADYYHSSSFTRDVNSPSFHAAGKQISKLAKKESDKRSYKQRQLDKAIQNRKSLAGLKGEGAMQKFSSFITEWRRGENRRTDLKKYSFNRRHRKAQAQDTNLDGAGPKSRHYNTDQLKRLHGRDVKALNKEAYQAHQMSTSRFKKFVDKYNPGVPDTDKKIFQATIKKGRVHKNADDAHYRTFKSNGKFAPKVGRAMGRLAAKSLSLSDKISNLASKRKVSESAPNSVRDIYSLSAKKAGKSIRVSRSKIDKSGDAYHTYINKPGNKSSIGKTNRKLRNLNNVQNKYDPGRRTMTKTTLSRQLRPYPKPAERGLMDTAAKKAERAKRKIGLGEATDRAYDRTNTGRDRAIEKRYNATSTREINKLTSNILRKDRSNWNKANKDTPGTRLLTKPTRNQDLRGDRSSDGGKDYAPVRFTRKKPVKESSTDIGSISKVRKIFGTDGGTSRAIKTISNKQMRNARSNNLLAKHGNNLPSDSRRSKRFKRLRQKD